MRANFCMEIITMKTYSLHQYVRIVYDYQFSRCPPLCFAIGWVVLIISESFANVFFFFYFAARNTSVALAYCKNYRYEKSPQSRPVWVPLMARLYLSAAIAASELNAPVVKFIYLFFVSWKVKFQEVKLDMHLVGTWQIFRRGNVLLFKLYFDVCYYIVLVVWSRLLFEIDIRLHK